MMWHSVRALQGPGRQLAGLFTECALFLKPGTSQESTHCHSNPGGQIIQKHTWNAGEAREPQMRGQIPELVPTAMCSHLQPSGTVAGPGGLAADTQSRTG